MAKLTIRIDLAPGKSVGHGKIRLLEFIGSTGSISAAGREMKMSYRRAWLLVDEINHLFKEPAVVSKPGGKDGGGARLTPFGRSLVRHYRTMERQTQRVLSRPLGTLRKASRG